MSTQQKFQTESKTNVNCENWVISFKIKMQSDFY